jgi:hypothetical protein
MCDSQGGVDVDCGRLGCDVITKVLEELHHEDGGGTFLQNVGIHQ